MAFSLKKWIGSKMWEVFMNEYNENLTMIETAIEGMISSGSNANGKWIKLADGTLICFYYSPSSYAYSEIPVGETFSATLTYPVAFVGDLPMVIHNYRLINGTYSHLYSSNVDVNSRTEFTLTLKHSGVVTARTGFYFYYAAFGRWKT